MECFQKRAILNIKREKLTNNKVYFLKWNRKSSYMQRDLFLFAKMKLSLLYDTLPIILWSVSPGLLFSFPWNVLPSLSFLRCNYQSVQNRLWPIWNFSSFSSVPRLSTCNHCFSSNVQKPWAITKLPQPKGFNVPCSFRFLVEHQLFSSKILLTTMKKMFMM